MVGLSVFEAMVVTFLSDLDGNCDQNSRRFADSAAEIELNDGGLTGKKQDQSISMVIVTQ